MSNALALKRRKVLPGLSAPSLHPVVRRVFAARGVVSESEIDYRLEHLARPDQLSNLTEAAKLVADAIQQQRKILVCGDFDADGATGVALAVRVLRAFGSTSTDYAVPNRFDFGYGLSAAFVEAIADREPELIITVDNGISSVEGTARARALGFDVLVTDHHLPGARLPQANAIVNPNLPGDPFPSKALAGVGTMFYLLAGVRDVLQRRDWFAGRPAPKLAEFLDLVAVGTVADLVPLDINNRRLVQQGLARIRQGRCCAGLRALLDIAGKDLRRVSAMDLGFAVGPRLNAAGRLTDMALGIECLLADNDVQAQEMALKLNELNAMRQELQADMLESAEQQLAQLQSQLDSIERQHAICLFDDSWHQGIVGLLASKIKDQLHRPVVVFAPSSPGSSELKGSVRSIAGYHVRDALAAIDTASPGVIEKFGGHAMAAGLSLRRQHLEAFTRQWQQLAERSLSEAQLQRTVLTDGELSEQELSIDTADALFAAGPWGQDFPEPQFEGCFKLIDYRLVGAQQNHLKLRLGLDQKAVDAIAFQTDASQLPQRGGDLRIVYQPTVNEFRGQRSLDLLVKQILI